MKIRTITYFCSLDVEDFLDESDGRLMQKLDAAKRALSHVESALVSSIYEVQTKRITFNSWTEWLPGIVSQAETGEGGVLTMNESDRAYLARLDAQLDAWTLVSAH